MHPANTSEVQVVGEADIRRLEAVEAAEKPAPSGKARAKGAAKDGPPPSEAAPAPRYSKPAIATPEPEEKKS